MATDVLSSVLPTLASAGFEARRHGTLRVAVCDTDFLMNQTAAATNPVTSRLARFSGINQRAYAAQHVFDELYRDDQHGHPTKFHKLSEQADSAGSPVSASALREAFEDRLLPRLTFVNMGDLFVDNPLVDRVRRARNGRGASDVPTAQLAVLLSRLCPVTYSHDEHLYKPGVAPRPQHLLALRGAEERVAQGEHLQVGAIGLTAATAAGIDLAARQIGMLLGSPAWLSRLAAVGLGTWALWTPERRGLVGRVLGPMFEAFFVQIDQVSAALAQLDAAAADVAPADAIECRIAEALVRRAHEGPLLAKEIQSDLTVCDPTFVDVPSVHELRSLLISSPCFEERPRWRYGLGHRYVRA